MSSFRKRMVYRDSAFSPIHLDLGLFMSSKEKPTLGNRGTWIKTRKRNIVAPLDPASFSDAVVQIYLDNAGDLELVARSLESSDLNFSRDGYTFFFEVLQALRRLKGTSVGITMCDEKQESFQREGGVRALVAKAILVNGSHTKVPQELIGELKAICQDNMTMDCDDRYSYGKPLNSFHKAPNIPDVLFFPR
ncbi:unnamed protein product [Fraxinus pennsylvanica]|uniref:5MP1/2-like HEAT domain-containing protein n=1 Tax=Fraxinus pennsylvanica TaxID=56036 RepID=A0AAD1Z1E0_9LAMI|nr:unnamed protein product [Fraxinus pennsylvanica]